MAPGSSCVRTARRITSYNVCYTKLLRARASELYKSACVGVSSSDDSMVSRCETLKKLIEAPADDEG